MTDTDQPTTGAALADELVEVTQADRDAVTAFHNAQLARILAGDKTLGENRDCIEQAFARHRLAALRAPAQVEGEAEHLSHIIDRDRYVVAIAAGHIRKALDGHRWLLEGRGPYEWDDDKYRDEFTDWVLQIEQATGLLGKLAWDKHDCTEDTPKVEAARNAARAYAHDAPAGHRKMLPSDMGLPCPSCSALTRTTAAPDDEAVRLRKGLQTIADLGSDGEHSGDRHAKCREIARAALEQAGGQS